MSLLFIPNNHFGRSPTTKHVTRRKLTTTRVSVAGVTMTTLTGVGPGCMDAVSILVTGVGPRQTFIVFWNYIVCIKDVEINNLT